MRPIDADKLMFDIKKNISSGIFKTIDIINNQPEIEPTELNKMYTLGILADILSQANYMITLSDGSQKLCVNTAVIDKIIDSLKADIDKKQDTLEENETDHEI